MDKNYTLRTSACLSILPLAIDTHDEAFNEVENSPEMPTVYIIPHTFQLSRF